MTFFAEQVTPGHPDKVADQISDRILDEILEEDPQARVAVETLVTRDHVVLAGEISTSAHIDTESVVKKTISDIGYTDKFWAGVSSLSVIDLIQPQSLNLTQNILEGAGDQGVMYGYAICEDNYLPPEYLWATKAAHALYNLHNDCPHDFGVDGKTTATVDSTGRLQSLTLAIHHGIPLHQAQEEAERYVRETLNVDCPIAVNTSGDFTIGGPCADTGLTGRKIIADTYGGRGRHGGGAFSGKDARKVDRTGAYYARWLAVRALEELGAYEVEVQIGYSIGDLFPRSLCVSADGKTVDWSPQEGLLSPWDISTKFGLRHPIHSESTCFGHFIDLNKPWNKAE